MKRFRLPQFPKRTPKIVWVFSLTYFFFFLNPANEPPLAFIKLFIKYQASEFLTFEELKILSANPSPTGGLAKKLHRLWTTPIISNEAYYEGVRPASRKIPNLGRFLRLASWNIEKSIFMANAIKLFTSPAAYNSMIDFQKIPASSPLYKKMLRQRQRLSEADILVLQEIDIGTKRSGYIDAARELARALKMNYAYAPEQIEIDPVYLGTEKVYREHNGIDQTSTDYFAADPSRYKGLFGCAVLSRYPIKYAEAFQLKNQAYDWYWSEKNKIAFAEQTRRIGTKVLFRNELFREMKVGGRIYFRVDLEVPELPEKTLTIINIHLEIKCLPKDREQQMAEILSYIKDIRHPVIVAGDFNSAPQDLSPTSVGRIVKRSAKDPGSWFNLGVNFLTTYGGVNALRGVSNVTKNFQNPLAGHIPVIAPNALKPLFEMIETYRFNDGGVFDFRGNPHRSINRKGGTLANSNQRDLKGFKTTFQVKRPIGPWLGKLRLDWIFVKSKIGYPENRSGPYRFAPHFGETLEEMNVNLKIPISDHHPNVVDLPFEEPNLAREEE